MKAKHRAVAEAIRHQASMHGIEMSIAVAMDLAAQALIIALADCDDEEQET